jgi:mevalonate kinase
MHSVNGNEFRLFGSKLLLFGEYSIVSGSKGLAIPFKKFDLSFTYDAGAHTIEQSALVFADYANYVEQVQEKVGSYDLKAFREDVKHGLKIRSTIPIGYGLGSSGAVIAAFYDAYCTNKSELLALSSLRKELGLLESFFHGASSGLDPLVCYLDKGVLISSKTSSEAVNISEDNIHALQAFLINSGAERRTAPLVNIYLEKMKHPAFAAVINEILIPENNRLVEAFIAGDLATCKRGIQNVSALQWQHFEEMIPENMKRLWAASNEAGTWQMKICGAGGGGFFLGFGEMPQELALSSIKI